MPYYNVKPKFHSCLCIGQVNCSIFSVTLSCKERKANKEISKNKASCNNSEVLLYSNFGCPCNKVDYISMLYLLFKICILQGIHQSENRSDTHLMDTNCFKRVLCVSVLLCVVTVLFPKEKKPQHL